MALDEGTRVAAVETSATTLTVHLVDGRSVSVPMSWFPRLAGADREQLRNWQVSAGGHGIHWPDLDEDLSTEGLLRGAPAPGVRA